MCTILKYNAIISIRNLRGFMNSVRINCQINDYLIECNGTKKNNLIIFEDNEYNILSFDYNTIELKKDKLYTINFKEHWCMFENGLKISIEVTKITCNNNDIIIKYQVGDQKFDFSLKYTDMKG